jgi:hypothetical protein
MQRIASAAKLQTLAALLIYLLFSAQLFAQMPGAAVPQLTGISPSEVTAGSFDFTLTVNGSNFTKTAVVRVNGSDRVTTYVSSTQLKAAIPSRDLSGLVQLQITVLNPGPNRTESQPLTLLVGTQLDPLISAVSPSKIIAGSGSISITLNGSWFFPDSVVQINGSNRPTSNIFINRLTATLSSADTAAPGFLNVSVFSPSAGIASNVLQLPVFRYGDVNFDGATTVTDLVQVANFISGSSMLPEPTAADLNLDGKVDTTDLNTLANYLAGNIFTLPVAAPPPALNALSPARVVAGGGFFRLTIDGINFPTDSVVRINGVSRFTEFVSSGRLAAVVAPVDIAASGLLNVSVFSPSGGTSNALTLTVFRYGDLNFDNTVTISDLALLANYLAGNATLIDPVTADLNLDGKVDTTDQTILANFIAGNIHKLPVLGPNPVVNAISPQKVVVGGPALSLTVDGSNFPSNAVVQVNGSNRPTSFVSANRLTVTIPATDILFPGFLDISVFSPDAGVNSNGLPMTIFRYGDLNFDNTIDISDLVLMGNVISGNVTLPDTAPADLNLDGRVDTADQTILANYLAGNIHSLPVVSDFSIVTSVDSVEITAGDTAAFGLSTTALNGFSGNITLTADGLPWGAGASFWPATITGSGSSTLYVSTSTQTLAGSYVITITGQSGALTHATAVTLTVDAAPSNGCDLNSLGGGLKDDFCPLQ